jgi:CheY-like chemotaxis protein
VSEQINVLVVEDNTDMLETYQDTAEDLSVGDLHLELISKKSADEAKSALLSGNFDGAIVDLNLDSTTPGEASGNEILHEIMDKHRFPVLVVSGNLGNLEPKLTDKESDFFKFFSRDTENNEVFNHLIKVYRSGITRILGGRGQIEQRLGEIFWKHLASDFSAWTNEECDTEKTLLRYTVSHMSEYLDIPDGEVRFYHEAEFYIKPPIREHIAAGDIVETNDHKRYLVLSPACDVAVRNAEEGLTSINADRIIVAPLIKVERSMFLEHGLIKESTNSNSLKKTLEEIIKGQRDKLAFLPGYGDMYAAVADFQNPHSWSRDEFQAARRLATISGIFMKDIQSRFSAYYGRQGQPDLNKTELVKNCKTLLSPNG